MWNEFINAQICTQSRQYSRFFCIDFTSSTHQSHFNNDDDNTLYTIMMLHFVFFSRFFRFFLLMFYFFISLFFADFCCLYLAGNFFVFINKYTNRLSTPCEFTPNWNTFDTICILHLRNWFFLYWFITNLFVFAVVTVRWMLMLWRLFVVDDYRLYFLLNLCVFFLFCIFIYIFGFSLLKIAKIYCEKKRKIRVHLNGLSILYFFFLLVTIWPFLWAARDLVFFFFSSLVCLLFVLLHTQWHVFISFRVLLMISPNFSRTDREAHLIWVWERERF